MNLFEEIFSNLPRQGPGCDAATRQALRKLTLPPAPRILDVGCGSGAQTLVLASETCGDVTAVDIDDALLQCLRESAKARGLDERIEIQRQSMKALEFPDDSFDMIWSEGAIYILGFERGLREWAHFLRPGGSIVVSEATWLKADPSEAARAFWEREYPQMRSIGENRAILRACGYEDLGVLVLPEEGWWDNYYRPMEIRIQALRSVLMDDPKGTELLEELIAEIELYRSYPSDYGYVFYLGRKAG